MNKRTSLLFIVASLVLVLAMGTPIAFAAPDPFLGAWESTDVDGSYQILSIGGGKGSSYHVRYYDFGASVCGVDPISGEILYAASARGTLTGHGNVLTGTLPVYCKTAPPTFWGNYGFAFTYNPGTDTLMDSYGVIWSRK